jgi:hypothetical protein
VAFRIDKTTRVGFRAYALLGMKTGLPIIACLFALCGAIFAHHGTPSSYDLTRRITLTGTVTEFAWSNPHVQIYFDVKDENGKVVSWAAETGSPGVLAREGWSKRMMRPGDTIVITVCPGKAGAPVGMLTKLVLSDGKEFLREVPGN